MLPDLAQENGDLAAVSHVLYFLYQMTFNAN